ncbi:MAG: malectin domain-containing carbohydrate-binding protein [Bryobacteraceae bacterium]
MSRYSAFRTYALVPAAAVLLNWGAIGATTQNFDGGGANCIALNANWLSNTTPATITAGGPTGAFLRLATTPAANLNTYTCDRTDTVAEQVVAEFDFRIVPPGGVRSMAADGLGFAFLNTTAYGATGGVFHNVPEEPLFTKSLGVGFRVYQTNTVYITYDNVRLAAVDLTGRLDLATGQFIHAKIVMRSGVFSDVTVTLTASGASPIVAVDRLAIPQFASYAGRVWFGARSGGLAAFHDIDNINVQYALATAVDTPFVQYLRSPNSRLISYSPTNFNPQRTSATGPLLQTPSALSITRDLEALRPAFDGLILYGTQTDILDNGQPLVGWILSEARRLGFAAIVLGIWEPKRTQEIDAAAALVVQYGSTTAFALAVCVGNEGIQRNEYGISDLDAARQRLAGQVSGIPIPVVTSESLARYTDYPQLRSWGDFLFPIIVPHWNVPALGPTEAAAWVRQAASTLANQSGMTVLTKEPSWPSSGAAQYTPETQRQFFSALLAGPKLVESTTFPGTFIGFHTILEGFDQYWKNAPDFTSWGILTADRVPKPAYWLLVKPAALTAPKAGTTLSTSSTTFQWSAGTAALEYFLDIGTSAGAKNLYSASQGTSLSNTVTLPLTGSPINVRLSTRIATGWTYVDYTFQTVSTGAFTPIRVNAGGEQYVDSLGQSWSADSGFSGGQTYATGNAITGTTDSALYRTERWNSSTLQYQFNCSAGTYDVTLKFAEIWFTSPGQRVFHIAINGNILQASFDPLAAAGGAYKAVNRTYRITVPPGGGTITIQLIPVTSNPKISAVEIISAPQAVSVVVNPPSVSLGPSQTQAFSATVSGAANQAVTWSLAAGGLGTITTNGVYQAPASISTAQSVTVRAMSQADGLTIGTATVMLVPPASTFTPIRVNAGGDQYVDASGRTWSTDTGFSGGQTYATNSGIAGTNDAALYRTERWNSGTLQYQFNCPAGTYDVTLKFAEIWFTGPGQRVFHIAINGSTVQANFDPLTAAGGANRAVDRTYRVTVPPGGGTITIQLIAVTSNPKVNAIEIVSAPQAISVVVNPPSVSLGPSQSQTFSATVSGTANQAVTWSLATGGLGTIATNGLYQAPASISMTQTVTVRATSQADGLTVGTATVTLVPPTSTFTPIRVNAGGVQYVDSGGRTWSADTGFSGGQSYATSSAISGTNDAALYRTERWNSGILQYQFNCPPGTYDVTLRFAEIWFTNPGQRVFHIAINGSTVQTSFDPLVAAGGANRAVDRTYRITVAPGGGTITIQLIPVTSNPKISAMEIVSF